MRKFFKKVAAQPSLLSEFVLLKKEAEEAIKKQREPIWQLERDYILEKLRLAPLTLVNCSTDEAGAWFTAEGFYVCNRYEGGTRVGIPEATK